MNLQVESVDPVLTGNVGVSNTIDRLTCLIGNSDNLNLQVESVDPVLTGNVGVSIG